MRREGQTPTDPAARPAALSGGRLTGRPALVFVPAEQLPRRHPDFRALRAGEERAREAPAGARDAARPEVTSGFAVPSDAELGLRPGTAQVCIVAVIAMLRGQQMVRLARSGQGPAKSGEANAPGGGIVEMADAVRALVYQALRAIEVLAPLVEDRRFQKGWPIPATVYRCRNLVAARLRTDFLALWGGAGDAVANAGLSPLRDDDEGPVVRDLPLPYTPGVTGNIAVLLEELADAAAQDQRYLDGLGQAPPAPGLDAARLIACKRRYRRFAASVLPSLTARAGDAASDRARVQTRYVLLLRLQTWRARLTCTSPMTPWVRDRRRGAAARPVLRRRRECERRPKNWSRRGPAR